MLVSTEPSAAHLGVIAAVLSGIAQAFQIGGWDGYALPLSYLLGAPTNMVVFGLLRHFVHLRSDFIASSGPSSVWSAYHIAWCASITLNWTLIGLLADIIAERPRPVAPRALDGDLIEQFTEAEVDPLMREFDELERNVRETRRPEDEASRRRAA